MPAQRLTSQESAFLGLLPRCRFLLPNPDYFPQADFAGTSQAPFRSRFGAPVQLRQVAIVGSKSGFPWDSERNRANPGDVVRMIVHQSGRAIAVGCVIAVLGGFVLGRLMTNLFYGFNPADLEIVGASFTIVL